MLDFRKRDTRHPLAGALEDAAWTLENALPPGMAGEMAIEAPGIRVKVVVTDGSRVVDADRLVTWDTVREPPSSQPGWLSWLIVREMVPEVLRGLRAAGTLDVEGVAA